MSDLTESLAERLACFARPVLLLQFRRVRAPSLTGTAGTGTSPNSIRAANGIASLNGATFQAYSAYNHTTASPSQTSAYSDSEAAEQLQKPARRRRTAEDDHQQGPATLESLPPLEEVIDGIKACFSSFFQVGFLHASSFIERVTTDIQSVNLLLVMALLAMGAPFTPQLCRRYGGKAAAGEREFHWHNLSYLPGIEKLSLPASNIDFCKLALSIIAQEMAPPSLDRTQAFIVLGVVHWNKGDGERGW